MTAAQPEVVSELARLPKAELHLHLEGCLTPTLLVQLAARHGEKLDLETASQRYNTSTFAEFLDLFKWATSFLREPQDYARLAAHVVSELRSQNCIYAEITLSIGVMLLRKQNVEANFAAILDAVSEVQSDRSVDAPQMNWIFDAARQFGPDEAMDVARLAAQLKSRGVVAFGLGGDENFLPTSDFRRAYDYAASEGLHRVAHAGEVGGPQAIRDAIETLGAERIGHGISAIQDEQLMDLLIERQIPLEICPKSNLCTGALARLLRTESSHGAQKARFLGGRSFSSDINHPASSGVSTPEGRQTYHENAYETASNQPHIAAHPLRQFVARGVPVTLSTDDPAMFRTSLNETYAVAASQIGISTAQLVSIAEAGFLHSFLPPTEKQSLLDRFHAEARSLNLQ